MDPSLQAAPSSRRLDEARAGHRQWSWIRAAGDTPIVYRGRTGRRGGRHSPGLWTASDRSDRGEACGPASVLLKPAAACPSARRDIQKRRVPCANAPGTEPRARCSRRWRRARPSGPGRPGRICQQGGEGQARRRLSTIRPWTARDQADRPPAGPSSLTVTTLVHDIARQRGNGHGAGLDPPGHGVRERSASRKIDERPTAGPERAFMKAERGAAHATRPGRRDSGIFSSRRRPAISPPPPTGTTTILEAGQIGRGARRPAVPWPPTIVAIVVGRDVRRGRRDSAVAPGMDFGLARSSVPKNRGAAPAVLSFRAP